MRLLTSTALFCLGTAAGGAGAYLATRDAAPTPSAMPLATATGAATPGFAPPTERVRLPATPNDASTPSQRLDVLQALASDRPEDAFAEALALKPARLRELALARVAREWALHDPPAAIAALRALTDQSSRRAFGRALFAILARVDSAAVLRYVLDSEVEDVVLAESGIIALAQDEPSAVIELIGEATSSTKRDYLQQLLVNAVAESDPLAAAALVESLPDPGRARTLYTAIGRAFAASDPEGALAWAMSLQAGTRQPTVNAILDEVANQDLVRGVEIALTVSRGEAELESLFWVGRSGAGMPRLSDAVTYNVDQLPQIADRLLTAENPRLEQALGNLLKSWSIADPDAALVWLLAQGPAVDPGYVASLAAGYAQGDIRLSAETADRLPPDARGTWVTEVAAAYAQRDPDAALEWLSRYRGSPEYDAWVSAAARRSLGTVAPMLAVRLLTSTTYPEANAVTAVVSQWTRLDPISAADWVLNLRDASVRSAGVAATTRSWLATDSDAAARWALNLPSGDVRDEALSEVLLFQMREGTVDASIVFGFGNGAGREAALLQALPALTGLARRDAAQARAIAAAYYTTPELRERAQEAVAGN